jgi:hypothetical protein
MAATSDSSSSAMASSEEPAMVASTEASSEAPAMAAASPILPSSLANDTTAAAAGDETEGYGYVGAWAVDAAACGTIDQPNAGKFAVITRSTFRDGEKAYFGNFGPLVDGKVSITVRAAQGTRTIAIEQAAADTLTVDGTAMVRCVQ